MTDTATLQIRVNGGAPQTGGIYVANSDTIQLTAPSKTGWSVLTRWEIYDYPEGVTCPAGWSTDTDDTIAPTYFYQGTADPPSFTTHATKWGGYKTRLVVPGFDTDEATFIKVLSPSGYEAQCAEETSQFGGPKLQKDKAYNANLQLIEDATAIFLTTPGVAVSAPPAVAAASALGNTSAGIALGDHTHAHGNQAGGALHADVSGSAAGFMSVTQRSDLITAKSVTDALTTAKTVARVAGDPATVADLSLTTVLHAARGTKTIYGTSTLGAAIEAAQAAGYNVELIEGDTYVLEKRIDLVDGLRIFCASSRCARVTSGFTNGDGADTDAGYVMRAQSTIGAQAGVHHATAYPGGRVVRWSFNPTPGATYQIVTGDASLSAATGMYDQTLVAGDYIQELATVVSAVSVGGGDYDVTLDRDLTMAHYGHASTTPTSKVYTVTTVYQTCEIENVFFDFVGTTHAVGLLASSIRKLTLKNVWWSGFSRGAVRATAGTEVALSGSCYGGTNAAYYLDACTGWASLQCVVPTGGSARSHASGVPRGLITLRYNCSDFEIRDSDLRNGCTGVDVWGGIDLTIRKTKFHDLDPSDRVSRDPGINPAPVGSLMRCGAAINQNGFTTGAAGTIKAYNLILDDVDMTNCGGLPASGADRRWPAAFFCDADMVRIGRIGVHVTSGDGGYLSAAPNYTAKYCGIMFDDAFDVVIDELDTNVDMPLMFSGNGASRVRINALNVFARNAYTSVVTWLLSMEDSAAKLSIGCLTVNELNGYLGLSALGSTPVQAAMEAIEIEKLLVTSTGLTWDNCFFAKATMSGAIGNAVEIYSNSGVRSARSPTGTHGATLAVAIAPYGRAGTSFVSGDWVLFSRGPNWAIASTEDPLRGAVLTLGTGMDVIEHVAGANYTPFGTVQIRKSAGLLQAGRAAPVITASAAKTASTMAMRDTSGGAAFATLTCDDLSFPAAETTPTISQVVATSGAGANLAIRAQQGASGQADGHIIVGQDNGATDASGDLRVELGQKSTSAKLALMGNGTNFFEMQRTSGFVASATAASTNWAYYGTASGSLIKIAYDVLNTATPGITIDQSAGFITSDSANGHRSQVSATTWSEVALVAAGRTVVGLALGANLNTTKMPANTGNGVIAIGNATADPTAVPDTSVCGLYASGTQLKTFRSGNAWESLNSVIGSGYSKVYKDREVGPAVTQASTSVFTAASIRAAFFTGLTGVGVAIVKVKGYKAGDIVVNVRLLKFSAVSGTLAVLTSQTLGTDDSASVTSFDISTDLRVRVTPADSTSTKWSCTIEWEFEVVT